MTDSHGKGAVWTAQKKIDWVKPIHPHPDTQFPMACEKGTLYPGDGCKLTTALHSGAGTLSDHVRMTPLFTALDSTTASKDETTRVLSADNVHQFHSFTRSAAPKKSSSVAAKSSSIPEAMRW